MPALPPSSPDTYIVCVKIHTYIHYVCVTAFVAMKILYINGEKPTIFSSSIFSTKAFGPVISHAEGESLVIIATEKPS